MILQHLLQILHVELISCLCCQYQLVTTADMLPVNSLDVVSQAENKTGSDRQNGKTWLLAFVGFSTCCSIEELHSDLCFFWWIPRGTLSAAYILACLKNWKIILVCFYYTAEWGWDSLHPQINLEGPALSAFYEENPPGDESWEYSQWQGRSCETGWFCPGWTFDGELWFHCAFHSLKGNTINPGLPYSILHGNYFAP